MTKELKDGIYSAGGVHHYMELCGFAENWGYDDSSYYYMWSRCDDCFWPSQADWSKAKKRNDHPSGLSNFVLDDQRNRTTATCLYCITGRSVLR